MGTKNLKENNYLNMSFNKSGEEIKKEVFDTKKDIKKNKKEKPYNFLFEVNEVVEDYFKQSKFITQMTLKDYLNFLIRQDMIKRIGAKENCTDEELIEIWENYKEKIRQFFNNSNI